MKALSHSHCCRAKVISITYFCLCVCVALGIRHTKRMDHIVYHLWPVLAVPYISTLYKKNCTIFGKKITEYNICVLVFSTNFD
jgi:hypothetical protein